MLALISVAVAAALHFELIGGPDFREALVVAQAPLSLDPLTGDQDPAVNDVGHLLYRSLLRLDSTAVPRPDLAQQFSVSSDGLTYHLTLAPKQRWSSGAFITPADVMATLGFLQTSNTADRRLAALVQGVKLTVAGADIAFTLAAPRASFAAGLTQIPILPFGGMSKAQLSAAVAHPSLPLPTSGAYRVVSASAANLDLQSNAHATTRPSLRHIRLDLFSTFSAASSAYHGGADDAMLATTPKQRAELLKRSGSVAHDIRTFQFVDVLFNERVPGLDDPVVRRAVATAVNRTAILRGALATSGGAPQAGAVSQGLVWAAGGPPPEAAAPAQAGAALGQDGWTAGPQGTRVRGTQALAFTLTVPNVDPMPTVASELVGQLGQIGISLKVVQVPADHFVSPDVEQHDFQLALGDWDGGPDPDVSAFWRSNASPPQGLNVSGSPVDPFLDQALDVLAASNDPQARVAAAASVNHDLSVDVPAIFLYTPDVSYVVHSPLGSMQIPATGGSTARFAAIASWHH